MRLFHYQFFHRTVSNRGIANVGYYRVHYATGFHLPHHYQHQQQHRSVVLYHHRRQLHVHKNYVTSLPLKLSNNQQIHRLFSVSGIIYDIEDERDVTDAIKITLFTKEGCTLCDKVRDVLESLRSKYPHQLVAVDITDEIYKDQWYEKYKYDIPVLHVNHHNNKNDDSDTNSNIYWAKHRITSEQVEQCFQEIQSGVPITPIGTEPNAMNSRPKGTKSNIL